MFSAKFNFLKGSNRLFTKSQLQTLDIVYNAQPFVNIVSKNQETKNLDIIYKAKPYIGIK